MEIRLARKELQVVFANLNNADYTNASIAAKDFLDFLHDDPEAMQIIESLPKCEMDLNKWQQNLYNDQDGDLPRKKSERVALMLAILEKNQDDLTSISISFRSGARGVTDHIRKYVDDMVRPIYQYVDSELHKKELSAEPVSTTWITASNSVVINGDNYGSISQVNNEAVQLLGELSKIIRETIDLKPEEKLEVVSNIDTIKNQMVSPKPNPQIIKLAWQTVSSMANVSGASDLIVKLAPFIVNFLA